MLSSNDQPHAHRSEQNSADAAVTEAKETVARHDCHEARNDLMALVLHQSSYRNGGEYDPLLVDGCLQRLRVLAETGCYPKEMLYQRKKDLQESGNA